MENKINRDKDVLARVFREKLANHQVPVNPALWDALEAKMNAGGLTSSGAGSVRRPVSDTGDNAGIIEPRTSVRKAAIWWIPLSAVAFLALLLTVGWFVMLQEEKMEHVYQRTGTEISSLSETFLKVMPDTGNYQPLVNTTVPETDVPVIAQAIVNTALVSETTVETKPEIATVTDNKHVNPDSPEEQLPAEVKPKQNKLPASTNDWTNLLTGDKRRKTLLAASVGTGVSGGNPGLNGIGMDKMTEAFLSSSISGISQTYALAPADFKTREYLLPVSAGLRVRIALADRLSLETGLQYTYLQTRLSDAAWPGYNAELQLHYLGVPLGITMQIIKTGNWEIYWTSGAMAEKGLRSVYREHRDWGNAIFTTTASTAVDGIQWSAFTSLGIGYNIDKNAMLYIEPQLSYYLDNDQPLSVRTAMPLMVGLNAGLRLSL